MVLTIAVLLFSSIESGVTAASEREQISELRLEIAGLEQARDSLRQALDYCQSQNRGGKK